MKSGADKIIVYLNGSFVPSDCALISIFDRGLMYGEGVLETIKGYGKNLVAPGLHFRRLEHSLRQMDIPWKLESDMLEQTMVKLVSLNHLEEMELSLRLTITSGTDLTGSIQPGGQESPSVIITTRKLDSKRLLRWTEEGVSVSLINTYERALPHIKSTNLLPNILLRRRAAAKDTDEGVFVENGIIREGSISNIFFVRDGGLFTPPADGKILPGIMRSIVFELAQRLGIDYLESIVTTDKIATYDEIFITNSIVGIVPVTRVDDMMIGGGIAGSVAKGLQSAYSQMVKDPPPEWSVS